MSDTSVRNRFIIPGLTVQMMCFISRGNFNKVTWHNMPYRNIITHTITHGSADYRLQLLVLPALPVWPVCLALMFLALTAELIWHHLVCSFLLTPPVVVFLRYGPPKLTGHSAVTYKDSMLLFGGGETQDSPKNCLWRYSFITQTWMQLTTLPGSNPPDKIHHCCTGLGPSYKTSSTSKSFCSDSGLQPRLLGGKLKPFKNKCFPAPDNAIELETFTPDREANRSSSELETSREALIEIDGQRIGSCLTFENKAFMKQWSCSEEEALEDKDGDITQHLPDLLLVLGGKPCTRTSPISMWQVTMIDWINDSVLCARSRF